MRKFLLAATCSLFVLSAFAKETIVMVRHGEKPADGLGQLSCQGLNRSLKLPTILEKKFGKPNAIFASNPSKQKADKGIMYDYVRPLATIEPTAIKFSLPVNTQFGFAEIDKIAKAIQDEKLHDSTVFVAWEHHLLVEIAKRLAAKDPTVKIPEWANDDFDSIYILEIDWQNGKINFKTDAQGLNNQPKDCRE